MMKTDRDANRRPKLFFGATFAIVVSLLLVSGGESIAFSAEPIFVWPDLAPGETSRETGTTQPNRKGEICHQISQETPQKGKLNQPLGGLVSPPPQLVSSAQSPQCLRPSLCPGCRHLLGPHPSPITRPPA